VDRWLTHRPGAGEEVPPDPKGTIRDRLLGILFSQSFDIVDRGIGIPADLNFGCQIALGFRKGPLDLMRDLGEAEVNRITQKFEKERPGFPQAQAPFASYQDFQRFVLVDDIDGVKIITLRRPHALNALSDEVTDEILAALEQYRQDPAVMGFVITGYGTGAFSAGADIGKFPQMLGDKKAAAQYARDCAKVQRLMDDLDKPVVAAVNGMALGGGLELAIRCHGIVATQNALLQFPEITLGILPGIGGCVVPYRKWPQGAERFHEMICLAKPLQAKEALELGVVDKLAGDYHELIREAVQEVKRMQGNLKKIPEGKVNIPEINIPDVPQAGNQPLSKEAVAIAARTIRDAAAAEKLEDALEIGYLGFGDIACTDAAEEGITAFLERRRPDFKK
jgi:enoyl-CoA hydratase/3-hydroxyacyl-CoA dehydrogenase